jgi:hypothetical protein
MSHVHWVCLLLIDKVRDKDMVCLLLIEKARAKDKTRPRLFIINRESEN